MQIETGVKERPSVETEREAAPERLSGSFSAALRKLGTGAALISAGVMLVGCSPQEKSYFSGAFIDLPPPPPEARLQLSVSTEEDGTVFINYVMWDKAAANFVRKDIHYTSKKLLGAANFGDFRQAGGYQQSIIDGEVLMGGAIVDQAANKILLPNGNFVDGPTGNILNNAGQIVKTFNHQQ